MQIKVRTGKVVNEKNFNGDICKEIITIAPRYGQDNNPTEFKLIITNPEDFGQFLPGHEYLMEIKEGETA